VDDIAGDIFSRKPPSFLFPMPFLGWATLIAHELATSGERRRSGCLDRCEDGPVVMAFYGQLAEEEAPSRELIKASLDDAAHTFTGVSARDVSTILDAVLEGRGYRAGIDVIEKLRTDPRRLKCGLSR
jgi:(2Fe-2S) ferredoxin